MCEEEPFVPVSVGGGGATRRDSTLHSFLRKAEVTAESSDGVGFTSR